MTRKKHKTLFLALIDGYRTGQLSNEVSLFGLLKPGSGQIYHYEFRDHLYLDICDTFPLEQVRSMLLENQHMHDYFPHAYYFSSNVHFAEAIRKVLARHGGRESLRR